jgi:hypothetical protein
MKTEYVHDYCGSLTIMEKGDLNEQLFCRRCDAHFPIAHFHRLDGSSLGQVENPSAKKLPDQMTGPE